MNKAFVLLAFLIGAAVWAQEPSLEVVQPMHFGSLSAGREGGMLSLTPDGLWIPLSPALRARTSTPAREARFLLKGTPRARFHLTLDPPQPFLIRVGGGRLTVAEFFHGASGPGDVFDAKGEAELRLGARLDIPSEAPAGLYQCAQVQLGLHVSDAKGVKSVKRSFSISAQLLPDITFLNLGPLAFAGLVPGQAQGLFRVEPDGSYHSVEPHGPRLLKGIPQPARFALQGPVDTCYSIQLPQAVLLLGPGKPILLKDFRCNVPLEGRLVKGGLDFSVGGSLLVPPDQSGGSYKGYFNVVICYP